MADYNLGTASGRIVVDGSAASTGFKVAQDAAGAFFDVVRSKVEDVQKLGRRMTAVGTAGVAGFGLAVKAASGFEKGMSQVFAVANANADQMDALRNKALQLGKDTQYSASEAASALEELIKAGVSTEDAINGAADATVALAAAGGVDLADAASIAANAMNAFEMSAKDVPKVADILAGVANTSASDVAGIGQSLSQAGAVAHLSGLSFRDTAIAIGEMANAGIAGSDAGTSIKTMLNNLIPTTHDQTARFEELGLITYKLSAANKVLAKEGLPVQKSMDGVQKVLGKYAAEMGKGEVGTWRNQKAVNALLLSAGAMNNQFFDAQGNIKNLRGLQDTLAKSLKGLSREQKLQTLEQLFGADAMRASAILSLEGAKGYDTFSKSVSKTKAADVAKTRMDNLSGAMEQFKGSMETVQIMIGNVLLPAITKLVQAGTAVLNFFIGLPDPIRKVLVVFGLILSSGLLITGMFLAMLPVIAAAVGHFLLMRVIGTVTKGFFTFYRTLRSGQGILVASRAGALATGGAMKSLSLRTLFAGKMMLTFGKMARAAWLMATGPIGIAIGVIAVLIGIGAMLYKRWKPFHDLVDRIAAVLKDKWAAAMAYLQPYIQKAQVWLAALGQVLRGKLLSAFTSLQKIGMQFVGWLKTLGQTFMTYVLPVIIEVGKQLLGNMLQGWKEIIKVFQSSVVPAVQQLSKTFTGQLIPALKELWAKIGPVVTAVGKFVGVVAFGLLIALGKLVNMFIKYVLPILVKVVGFLLGVVIGAVVSLVKGIIQAVTGIISIFTGLINFFKGLFTGNWSQMWEGIKQIFTGIWDLIVGAIKVYLAVGVLKAVGLAFGLLRGIVSGGWKIILRMFRGAGKGLWSIVKGAFRLIVAGIRGYVNLWRAIFSRGWQLIQAVFTRVLGIIRNVLVKAWDFIRGRTSNSMTNIRTLIARAWDFVRTKTVAAFQAVVRAVSNGISSVLQFIRELPGKILSALGNIGDLLYGAGRDLVLGMLRGIRNFAGKIKDAAADLAKSAVSAVTDHLKIGSPSKVMFELGGWTGEGLANGIKDQKKNLMRTALEASKALMDGMNANLDPKALRAVASGTLTLDTVPVAASRPAPAAATPASQKIIYQTNHINNPVPERAGQSVSKVLRTKAEQEGWTR